MDNQPTASAEKPPSPAAPKSRSKRSRGAPPWVANVIMLVLGIIIGGVGHWLIAPSSTPGSLFDAVVARTRHFKGNANAPVTLVEFSDFQ